MSNAIIQIESRFNSIKPSFDRTNQYGVKFESECHFAKNLLKNNKFLLDVAMNNPESLEQSLLNISAIGISINPALKEAYLIPRDGKVVLDISYIGLVKLATDTGSVEWVQVETVRESDLFEYQGVGLKPIHKFDPFADRGEIKGGYCVAKLASGDFLVTVMSKKEVDEIREKSSKVKSDKGPWSTFYEEMMKKTILKRASKLWPKSERVKTAVEVINEHEGIDFKEQENAPYIEKAKEEIPLNEATFKNIRDLLTAKGRTEIGLLNYLSEQFKTPEPLCRLEELNQDMINSAYKILGGKK